jgi:hypothetical protein
MAMVGEERPGVDRYCARFGQRSESPDEILSIAIVAEKGTPFNPSHHHMMESSGRIEAGSARHERTLLTSRSAVKK